LRYPDIMDFWEWAATTMPAGAIVNAFGLGALAILFATDRVLTKGQHTRALARVESAHDKLTDALTNGQGAAVAELIKHHDELGEAKDALYSEMTKSRDYYRDARLVEQIRANTVTDQLGEVALEIGKLANHTIGSFNSLVQDEAPE